MNERGTFYSSNPFSLNSSRGQHSLQELIDSGRVRLLLSEHEYITQQQRAASNAPPSNIDISDRVFLRDKINNALISAV